MVALTGTSGALAGSRNESRKILFHLEAHDFERVGIDEIGFGQDGQAATDVEHAADIEVLAGLRFDGFVGGDHQDHQVDPADAGQHVAHEAFVAGDIDKTEAQTVATVRRGQLQMGEPDIDGDAAAFLFFETVGIDAGERAHQRALAMIDVSGGADGDGFHRNSF